MTTLPPEPDVNAKPPAAPDEAPAAALVPKLRGLGVMAALRWILLILVSAVAVKSMATFWGAEPAASSAAHVHSQHLLDRYYCPMHPQIRSPEPGECPICHMTLEPIPAQRQALPSAGPSSTLPALGGLAAVTLSAEKQHAAGIALSEVTQDVLGGSLRVPGVVSAPESGASEVRVRAAGFVEKVAVNQSGVQVVRGQTLAWVYSPEIYRAQEEFLAAARWSKAVPASAGPASAGPASDLLSAARRSLELLGLETQDIEQLLQRGEPLRALPVRAPSAGYVTRFNAVLGSRASPETPLYELVDLASVWVIASVHESDIAGIRVGSAAHFTVTSREGKALNARVELLEPQLDVSTRTSRVRLVLKNYRGQLRPGEFGELVFDLAKAPGLFVPRDAVVRTGQREYVYVSDGAQRFEPRLVHSGAEVAGRVQILSGLVAGERVVTRGSFMLDSESRLSASFAALPAASAATLSAPAAPGSGPPPSLTPAESMSMPGRR